uniref:Uncharacterized protein n=1 Tax=Klebsiella pneumoniae TaxID=573 RepID=A0A8B0SRX9_KLEPN|nr:hypothetical protein [Klebsiella pneumoniae]
MEKILQSFEYEKAVGNPRYLHLAVLAQEASFKKEYYIISTFVDITLFIQKNLYFIVVFNFPIMLLKKSYLSSINIVCMIYYFFHFSFHWYKANGLKPQPKSKNR